jgi:hypothetical protein
MDLPEWLDLDGRLAGLQELPIVMQLLTVNLGPGLHEPLLRSGQAAAETLDRIDREHGRLVRSTRGNVRDDAARRPRRTSE